MAPAAHQHRVRSLQPRVWACGRPGACLPAFAAGRGRRRRRRRTVHRHVARNTRRAEHRKAPWALSPLGIARMTDMRIKAPTCTPPSFPKAEQPTVHLPRPWCGIRGAVTCDIAPVANAIDPRRGPPGAPVAAHAVADRAELLPLRHPPQASGLRALRVPASPRPPLSRSPCNALCGRRRPRAPALPSTDTAAVIVLFPSAPGTSDGTMAAARQLLAVLVAAAALLGVAVAQVRPSVEHPARG